LIKKSPKSKEFVMDADKLPWVNLSYAALVLSSGTGIFALRQLPQKVMLATKVDKNDSKLTISFR